MPLVLDVRDRKNYEAGHAIEAYNIPFDELRDRGFEMPSHKTPLVVECEAALSAACTAMLGYDQPVEEKEIEADVSDGEASAGND